MKKLQLLLAIPVLLGCTSASEEIRGRWKYEALWTEKEDKHGMLEYARALHEGADLNFDDSILAYMSGRDTINYFPYDITGDTMTVHTRGLDVQYTIEFSHEDTLLMRDSKEGFVLKLSRRR